MVMKSKELKSYNLPTDDEQLSELNAKPTALFMLFIVLGISLIFMKLPIANGIILIIIGAVGICFMPRVTLIRFFRNYLVMYNRADKNKCILIYYNEVKSWYYSWSAKKDKLIIELEDGTIESIEAFSKTIFEAYMYKHLREKHKKNK